MAPKIMAIRWSVHQHHAPKDDSTIPPLPTTSQSKSRGSSSGSEMSLDKPYHAYHTLSALQTSRSFDRAARSGVKHGGTKSNYSRMSSKSSIGLNKPVGQTFRKFLSKMRSRSEVMVTGEPNLDAAPVGIRADDDCPAHAQLRPTSQRDIVEYQREVSTASSHREHPNHSSAPSRIFTGSILPKAASEISLDRLARIQGPQHSTPSLVSSGPSPISSPSLRSSASIPSIPSIPPNNSACSPRIFPGQPGSFDGDACTPAATVTTVCYASPRAPEQHSHSLARLHRRPTTPPHLASSGGPRRRVTLRLFPTPAPPQDLPIAPCKRLTLAPDRNFSTTHLRPQPSTRRNASTSRLPKASNFSSSAKSVGHGCGSGSEGGSRGVASNNVTRRSISGQSRSSEDRRPSLKEWELDSFALRYEDTAKCGEPFRTKRAAELRWGKRW